MKLDFIIINIPKSKQIKQTMLKRPIFKTTLDVNDAFAWYYLADNPNPLAITILEQYLNEITRNDTHHMNIYTKLSENENAVHILEKKMDKINWLYFCKNKNKRAMDLIEKNVDKISWFSFSSNPNGIDLLEKNMNKIKWDYFGMNTNPKIIDIIDKNQDKLEKVGSSLSLHPCILEFLEKREEWIKYLNWRELSRNPNAIPLLEKNMDKIDWECLSSNKNAVHLLEKNKDKIDWEKLCSNINAIELIKKNKDKIDWVILCENANAIEILEENIGKISISKYSLCCNPNALHLLFGLDFYKMREGNKEFAEELAANVFHPQRMVRLSSKYGMDFDEWTEIYS